MAAYKICVLVLYKVIILRNENNTIFYILLNVFTIKIKELYHKTIKRSLSIQEAKK